MRDLRIASNLWFPPDDDPHRRIEVFDDSAYTDDDLMRASYVWTAGIKADEEIPASIVPIRAAGRVFFLCPNGSTHPARDVIRSGFVQVLLTAQGKDSYK